MGALGQETVQQYTSQNLIIQREVKFCQFFRKNNFRMQ